MKVGLGEFFRQNHTQDLQGEISARMELSGGNFFGGEEYFSWEEIPRKSFFLQVLENFSLKSKMLMKEENFLTYGMISVRLKF